MSKSFKDGDRVKVIRCDSYKRFDLTGELGTIISGRFYTAQFNKVLVALDNEQNPYSGSGYFYFKPYELSLINEETNIMEEKSMSTLTNYINIAKIKYLDNRFAAAGDYANFDESLKVGDLCVAKSLTHGFGLATVVEIIDRTDIQTCREIVARVDTDAYDQRVECRKTAEELKNKMQERAKQLQDIALYTMLAEKDPSMQELLDRYKALPQY